MNYYVIGIGGTGAKCVEALIHLCAAGLMPRGDLYAMFVDPDRANGSLGRAETTAKQYMNCRGVRLGASDLCRTPLTIADPDVWSPFGDDPRPRLDTFFRYNNLLEENENAARLFDTLYSEDEKQTSLEEGFRGHPSIGAAVMASTLELGQDEPWHTFRNKIALDIKGGAGAKVALFGSIFGGTGASGLPTIARLIRNELGASVRLGGILMLPYFSFTPVENEKLRIDAEDFLLNTQAALKYYYQQDNLKICDAVYLMGDEALSPVTQPSIGGNSQRNEPHFMEVYAALAGIDFFENDDVKKYPMIARRDIAELNWNDLPFGHGFEILKGEINHLARFAFAYVSVYHPMLKDIYERGRGYRAPWYVNFFERRKIDLKNAFNKELLEVKEYCESLLIWLANIQTSAKDVDINLINYQTFSKKVFKNEREIIELLLPAEFRLGDFTNLTLPEGSKDVNALSLLWEAMSEAEVRDPNAAGLGRFFNALYRECGNL